MNKPDFSIFTVRETAENRNCMISSRLENLESIEILYHRKNEYFVFFTIKNS